MLGLIWSLISGGIIGAIASRFMGEKNALVKDIILGILGSFVGKFLFSLIGVYTTGLASGIVSVIGACIVIWLGNKLFNNK